MKNPNSIFEAYGLNNETKMLVSPATMHAFSNSRLFPRCAPSSFLVSFPYSLSLKFCGRKSILDVVPSFNHISFVRPLLLVLEISKISNSIEEIKHYRTGILLFAQTGFEGPTASLVTLSFMINCSWHVGRVSFVFSLLWKIPTDGNQVDIISLIILMEGLGINNKIRVRSTGLL